MLKLFEENELRELPIAYSFLKKDAYAIYLQVLRQVNSDYHQNEKKQKLHGLAKPISKTFTEDDLL